MVLGVHWCVHLSHSYPTVWITAMHWVTPTVIKDFTFKVNLYYGLPLR